LANKVHNLKILQSQIVLNLHNFTIGY